jgi:GT2 family glycosyltransferase
MEGCAGERNPPPVTLIPFVWTSSVSAVIPTWNRADLLRAAIHNLQTQTRPPQQILVVDNGSTDGSASLARELGVDCIELESNRGFAVAVNEGIRHAKNDWVLIINNDVLLAPDWLEILMRAAEDSDAEFLVGKLLQSGKEGVLDGSWDLVSRGAYAWRCGYERADGGPWSTRRKIALAPMTAALFRRSVFDKIGNLETRFESYYEDVDFGIRCALAGIHGLYEPRAVATHLGKATFGKRAARVYFLSGRNQVLLLAKHYPAATLWHFAWPILVGQSLALMAAGRQGHLLPALKGKLQALWRWREFRKSLPSPAAIEAVTRSSEREISDIQRSIGFDIYWRLYFSLVGTR